MRKNELSSINSVQRFYSSVCVHLARMRADAWTTKCTVPKTQKAVLQCTHLWIACILPFLIIRSHHRFCKICWLCVISNWYAAGRHTTGCIQRFQKCTAYSIDVSNMLFSKPALWKELEARQQITCHRSNCHLDGLMLRNLHLLSIPTIIDLSERGASRDIVFEEIVVILVYLSSMSCLT